MTLFHADILGKEIVCSNKHETPCYKYAVWPSATIYEQAFGQNVKVNTDSLIH